MHQRRRIQRSKRAIGAFALLGIFASLIFLWQPQISPGEENVSFTNEQLEFFEKEVEPILKARCFKCHGAEEKIRGSLDLTSREGLVTGGDQGSAIDLKSPAESLLLKAINYDGIEMPPSGKLPKNEIDILTKWISQGAPSKPGTNSKPAAPKRAGIEIDDEARNYWAYRPLQTPEVPKVKHQSAVRNPIDAFLLQKLEAKGLEPNPPADPIALIRRVYYDLTGLPPTPEAVDQFVADHSDAAYERLIDHLLDSPQYGEKWGRHWLDLVRFAETHGYERDSPKPFAWRYRDYVINAFNADKPYDQFLREQLAGDEQETVTAESLTATGYYRLGLWDDEPADRPLAKYDVLDGIVSTTGQVMLGMSVGCARCHDHKKDPIPQKDYYRLLAFFRDVADMNVKNTRMFVTEIDRHAHAREIALQQQRIAGLLQKLEAQEEQFAAAVAAQTGEKSPAGIASDLIELRFKLYRDTWDQIPNFDSLKPETTGIWEKSLVSLAAASRAEAIGLVFEGQLRVPEAAEYAFHYDASEGLRVTIDGKRVIDQSGRGKHQGSEKVSLPSGLVPIRVEYFNNDQKPHLKLSWQGAGRGERLLTDDAAPGSTVVYVADSRREAQTWNYTETAPTAGWEQPGYDDGSWKQGRGGFGRRGTPAAVVRTNWHSENIWLRKTFRAEAKPSALSLDLHHDDEIEVYLNGKPILKKNGHLIAYERVVLPPAALEAIVVGDNVLAVHCHQTSGGQYVDVGLVPATDRERLRSQFLEQGDQLLGAGSVKKYQELLQQVETARNEKLPQPGTEIMCVSEQGQEATHVLIRGNPGSPGDVAPAGFPIVLGVPDPSIPGQALPGGTTGKRTILANWITSRDNPLPSRVMANRLWQFHFGRGIVPTPNDFGKLGEGPTHPELLDWLATEFMRCGWSIKAMHRLMMTSNAYRMSAAGETEGLDRDPANHLYWRFNPRRLTAEEVRDSILVASGALNLKQGGPGTYPPIPKEVLAGQSVPGSGWGNSPPEEASRRSVYIHLKRSLLVPILSQHDLADTDSSCAVRFTTTVPTQALGMLNGEFTNEQAEKLAQRLEREAPDDLDRQIARGIRLTTSRPPTGDEVQVDRVFINKLRQAGANPHRALTQYCLLLLNANEFVYLD